MEKKGDGMRNTTLNADERLTEAARAKAREEHTTLNEQFRAWLSDYTGRKQKADAALATVEALQSKYATEG